MQGEAFDTRLLNLQAIDDFDGDISDKIIVTGDVEPSIPGDYELHAEVSDSSGNKAETVLLVHVEAMPQIDQPADDPVMNAVSDPDSITVMINKQNTLPDGWEPADLVSIGNNHYLRKEAAKSLEMMRNDAQNSGISFNVISSYRSQTYQTDLYNRYMASDPYNAPYYSAYPRTSEHELGLAVDISYDYSLHNDLAESELGQWMAANAHNYGWIMRYPEGKTESTGYYYEAWHWRYVGTELAEALYSSVYAWKNIDKAVCQIKRVLHMMIMLNTLFSIRIYIFNKSAHNFAFFLIFHYCHADIADIWMFNWHKCNTVKFSDI